jgi:hypothetical protein
MTDGESDPLVQEYEQNNKAIAVLRSALDTAGSQMSILGDQLRRNPLQVIVEGGEFSITDEFYVSSMGRLAVVERRTISVEVIEEHLSRLKSCMKKKREMEDRLREAGLDTHIQK